MSRMIADCRRFESESNCSMTMIGEEEELVAASVQHAVGVHGHEDTPQLREMVRSILEPEDSYIPGTRVAEPYPA